MNIYRLRTKHMEMNDMQRKQKTSPKNNIPVASKIMAVSHVGMTIIEIMIVLTIVASLMGAIGFVAFGAVDKADDSEAQIRAKRLTENVEMYYMTSSPKSLPNSLEDLARGANKLIDRVEPDPWGNEFIYTKMGGRNFEIRSAGRDGSPNTEDDICADGPCSETSE